MPGVLRLGDICSGHGCFPPRVNVTASNNVFINNRGVHRQGDAWSTHCCGSSCHSSIAVSGSSNFFVNGRKVFRVGDPVGCGSVGAVGSPNVFANG